MSTQNCHRCKNPLLRDGTSQPQRFFPELDPNYISVDERSIIDLLDYSLKSAEKIRFWELDNVSANTGDWINFIQNDIATLHSEIAKNDLVKLRAQFYADLDTVNATPTSNGYQELINDSIDIALKVDAWYLNSIPGSPLNADLFKIIQSQAAPNLRILVDYDINTLSFGTLPTKPPYPQPFSDLSPIWGDFSLITPDPLFYPAGTDAAKIQFGLPTVVPIFESMLNALDKLAKSSLQHFDKILTEYPEHEAHMTLLLTFYQLFQHAQDLINETTKKHIDFYYKDVLRLVEKAQVPDHMHLVFEPAKNVDGHLIEEGTLFKAGKDDTGKNILFATDRNVIINRATVDSVKNVFVHKNADEDVDYIFAAPVADSLNGMGDEPNLTGWKLFGQFQKDESNAYLNPRTMPDANVGFAIASPELFLKEGERTIEIDLQFGSGEVNTFISDFTDLSAAQSAVKNQLKIYFSGAETWIQPVGGLLANVVVDGSTDKIKITAGLIVDQPAIVPYNRDVLGDPFMTVWPVAKLLISQSNGSILYEPMRKLHVKSYKIAVDVKEAVSLVVANDNGTLDASKPFQPFGAIPEIGGNFYIGSAEIFSRKLTSLSVTMDWLNMPSKDMVAYYKEYRKSANVKYIDHHNDFSVKLKMLDQYRWWDLNQETTTVYVQQAQATTNENFSLTPEEQLIETSTTSTATVSAPPFLMLLFAFLFRFMPSPKANRVELFNYLPGTDPRLPHTITVGNAPLQPIPTNLSSVIVDQTFQLLTHGYKRDVFLQKEDITEYTNNSKRGFIRMELNSPGFLHDVYPKIQIRQAMALAKWTTGAEPALPNEPYTPTVKLLGIDYKSEHTVDYSQAQFTNYGNRVEQLFHVGPFGVAEIFPVQPSMLVAENPSAVYLEDGLLPLFTNNDLEVTPEIANGGLYIGLKDFDPPRSLSLFFQFDPGTENPDLEVQPVIWSYLSNNQWVNFDARQVVYDSTNGLVNSGIIEFAVPSDMTSDNTLLPEDLHWLRVQTYGDSEAFSNVLSLKAQAVSATYADNGNDPERLRKFIDPATVSKFVKKDFAIKKVEQPYPSFGGRIKEQSAEFYVRAAERLRHKNRAITVRDYEHLVLEAFPEIYKVKCINHTSKLSENAPGSVSVITVLDPKLRNDKNPFELKVSKANLETIKRFVQELNSTFVDLDVRNPSYEHIETDFSVVFRKEFADATFYRNLLADDIRRFLSPWAFGEERDIIFGGRLEKSIILNFIEERPYVDYVSDFKMHQYDSNGDPIGGINGVEEAIAQTASSILITNETHFINFINS
jgi:hypothetical protein